MFATFPGADGATSGVRHNGQVISLVKHALVSLDVEHNYRTFLSDYDNGKMDGFDLERFNRSNQKAGTYYYQYVDPSDIKPYWSLAQQYGLADHMFQTQGSSSFTAHQDLIAGGTSINSTQSLIDLPTQSPWGCDAPQKTVTSLINTGLKYLKGAGPFPCLNYPSGTMRDSLDSKGVSWRYYTPQYGVGGVGSLWNAFAVIQAVRESPEWNTNISMPETNILSDIAASKLPAVAWVIPDSKNSDHPSDNKAPDHGPSWVRRWLTQLLGKYWKSTGVIIVWDDWGGFYDHEPPAFFDNAGGLGFRVPAIVVSPYVPKGTISHTQYEFGSILKFIEKTFGLRSLGTTDVRASSIGDMFNFTVTSGI